MPLSKKLISLCFSLFCGLLPGLHGTPVLAATPEVIDDAGHRLRLPQPAQRVISLAPHVTELLFAAGAGAQVVGVSSFSDFPAAAEHLPQIGDARQLDLERIIQLQPDLLVVWASGTPARQIEQLKKLGIPMFYSEPRKLDDIASDIVRLGLLLGTRREADAAAKGLQASLQGLRSKYRTRRPVRVFYQISDNPLYTLNGQHIVSDGFSVCGAQNVFADLPVIAPSISTEAVLRANPEIILGSETNTAIWKQYPALLAARRDNLRSIDGNLLSRAGPRMVEGVRQLCELLDQARRWPAP